MLGIGDGTAGFGPGGGGAFVGMREIGCRVRPAKARETDNVG
jgi:hypothetical protein